MAAKTARRKPAQTASKPRKRARPSPKTVVETTRPRAAIGQVKVDNRTRRDDSDALEGHFIEVDGGDHKGRYGVYEETLTNHHDGYPNTILVRTRDEKNELLTVDYKHARHVPVGARR